MLSYDDPEIAKTEEEMANRPWGGALVSKDEGTGEEHLIPLSSKEASEMIRNGEIDCNSHEESPLCFCQPFLSVKDENRWIHRRV